MLLLSTTTFRHRSATMPVARRTTRLVWLVALANGMNVVWMAVLGDWFDQRHLLSMATWGGHHRLVLATAVCALIAHAVLAALTLGFTEAPKELMTLTILACLLATAAMLGVLALAAPLIIIGIFVGVVGWMLG